MNSHRYEKDRVCLGRSFLCSPVKANRAGADGSFDAQTGGGGAQHYGRYSQDSHDDRRQDCGRRSHEDSHGTSYQYSRSDYRDMNRSWSPHHHNSYDSRHCQFRKSMSPSDRTERSRSSSRYRYSRKSVSPFNRRSRSSCQYHYYRTNVSPFEERGRSRSGIPYHYLSKSVFPFNRREWSGSGDVLLYGQQHDLNSLLPSGRRAARKRRADRKERRNAWNWKKTAGSHAPDCVPTLYSASRNTTLTANSQHLYFSPASTRIIHGLGKKCVNSPTGARDPASGLPHKSGKCVNSPTGARDPASGLPHKSGKCVNSPTGARDPASGLPHESGKCVNSPTGARDPASGLPHKSGGQRCCPQSVFRLLVSHPRCAVDQRRMHTAWVLSSASSLQRTESRKVSGAPQFYENLEHMTHMSANADRSQLLCMWSVSGTALQQVQVLDVGSRPRARCGDLPLELRLSDSVLQSWCDITSLCWAAVGPTSAVLYTTTSRTGQRTSCANIRFMDSAVPNRLQYADYLLGHSSVWACAWNPGKVWLGAGLDQQCQVIDAVTRQFWKFQNDHGKVHSLVFSKTDTGNSLYSGVSSGVVLMHDVRKNGRKATVVVVRGHRRGICDLKLSPDEHHLYTSDLSGQISRWDLRMHATQPVMTYEGLTNGCRRLPFHIDHTQSVIYAAGVDCCTKIWSLQSGELLNSLPPPYPAHPDAVPAVQLSSQWAGVPGTMGLIMGAHHDLHLYTSGV